MGRTKGSQSEIGMTYQYAVTAYLAGQLSANELVKDYSISSSEDSGGKFDDIVAKVQLKDEDAWFLTLIQVKHKDNKKLNISDVLKEKKKGTNKPIEYEISSYISSFNQIMDDTKSVCRQGIPNDNVRFCIFCNQSIQTPVLLRGECTFKVNLQESSNSDSTTKTLLPFGNRYWNFQCEDLVHSEEYRRFFDGCYLYLHQENVRKIHKRIQDICQIDNADDIINYVQAYFNNDFLYKQGLNKRVFDMELQKIRLSNFVPPLTQSIDLVDDERVALWNEITLEHDITIVSKADDNQIEGCLYACLNQRVNLLLGTNIDWNAIVVQQKALDRDVIDKFIKYSKTKTLRYWISPPDSLKHLILELWKLGNLPLILRTDIKLNNFENYVHLERSYVVIGNIEEQFDKVSNKKLKIFSHAGNISSLQLRGRMLENTVISLQGRKETTLKDVLLDDIELLGTFSSTDIIGLMKKRIVYLKKDCLVGSNHLLFIIEDRRGPASVDLTEPPVIGDNITIECQPGNVSELVSAIVGKQSYEDYVIYYLRRKGQHLELVQGDKEKLSNYFIDQFGDPVLICAGNIPIPIIGNVIPLNEINRIGRYLRRATISDGYLNLKSKVVFLLSGDVKAIAPRIEFTKNGDISERDIMEERRYFIKVSEKGRDDYWNKFSKCAVLDVIVRDAKMELIRYKNCSNLISGISYAGRRFSEREFFEENGKNAITVVTGEPGMGKTSVLRFLCNMHSENFCVLHYDLIYFQQLLKLNRNLLKKPLQNIFEEFHKDVKKYNDFLCTLRKKRKIILLLDAFDEIVSSSEEEALKFIRSIANTGIQIVVASRLKHCGLLVDELNALVVKLDPLDTHDDKEYPTKWKLNAETLAALPLEFTTNPLYLNFLRLLSVNGVALESITRFVLYEKVIYMKIKGRLERIMKTVDESDIKKHLEAFEHLALVAMFGKKKTEEALKWIGYIESLACIRFGIVTHFEGDLPIFGHFTFIEFLVAQWLAKAMQIYGYRDVAKAFYKQMMDEGKLYVFDILSEHLNIHKAVLDEDIIRIKSACEDAPGSLKDVDKLGRTALHLATICCVSRPRSDNTILDILVKSLHSFGFNMNQHDLIMGWNWTDYVKPDILFRTHYSESKLTVELYLDTKVRDIQHIQKCKRMRPSSSDYCFLLEEVLGYAIDNVRSTTIRNILFLQNYENEEFYNLYKASLGLTLDAEILRGLELSAGAGLTALHIACLYGSESVVKQLTNIASNVDVKDELGFTPLIYNIMRYSSYNGNVESSLEIKLQKITKLLLEKGANVNIQAICGLAPLHIAAKEGNEVPIQLLLKKDININLQNYKGSTPLHIAVNKKEERIIRMFLENGANINIQDGNGDTPLHIAAGKRKNETTSILLEEFANAEIRNKQSANLPHITRSKMEDRTIRILLESDANVNIQNQHGDTPLHLAASEEETAIVRVLLEKGADANIRNKYGATPLHTATRKMTQENVWMLLAKGANVNIQDENGDTSLHLAAYGEEERTFRALLEKGADVNIQNKHGTTPLHTAAHKMTEENVSMLLAKGANVNIQDENGDTPLHLAAFEEEEEIFRILLRKGADVNIQNKYGTSPLHTAAHKMTKQNVWMLLKKGAHINIQNKHGDTPLHLAAFEEEQEIFRILLHEGADVNIQNKYGTTPLHTAARKMVRRNGYILLGHGANFNIQDENGDTPLHNAAGNRKNGIINTLIGCFSGVNIQNEDGTTPLHIAVRRMAEEHVLILLKNGANVNIQNENGDTPLHIAAGKRKDEIFRILLKNHANIEIRNIHGATPLHTAAREMVEENVLMLLEKGANVNIQDENGDTPLHIAASKRKDGIFRILLQNYANTEMRNKHGATPLHIAAREMVEENVRMLLEKGANVNIQNQHGDAPLHLAASEEEEGIVRVLLEKGADVNVRNKYGTTPLHTAARKMTEGNVRMLLEKGANVNIQDENGYTPLHIAAYEEEEGNIRILLEKGADVNIRNKHGTTPLHTAARKMTEENVRMLLEKDANVNIQDENGETPLHIAAGKRKEGIFRILLEESADVNIRNKHGATSLHIAARKMLEEQVQMLLKRGANINIQDEKGDTPLHIAAGKRKEEIFRILLKNYANTEIRNNYGATPLHTAAREMVEENVRMLLEKSANVNIQNQHGETPLHLAACNGEEGIIRVLLKKGADVNIRNKYGAIPLHTAVRNMVRQNVQMLIERGTSVNVQDENGDTPLHLAAYEEEEGIVRALLEKGADVNIRNKYGVTPLHNAARSMLEENVQMLIESGANVNIQDENGETPLHIAAGKRKDGIFRILLKNYANTEIRNKHGATPLHIAAREMVEENVWMLLENGASVNIQDEVGDTPLHLAASKGEEGIIRILQEKGADVNIRNKYGAIPLHTAVHNMVRQNVRMLLEKGTSVNI